MKDSTKELLVSIANALIEEFCKKYTEEYEFDNLSIGINDEGEVVCYNGDDIDETLNWVLCEVFNNLKH